MKPRAAASLASRRLRGRKAPRNPAAHHIEGGIDSLPQRPGARPSGDHGKRKVRLDYVPFLAGQVALVARPAA